MKLVEAENLIKSLFKNVKWKEPFYSKGRYHLCGDTYTNNTNIEWTISFRLREDLDLLTQIAVSLEKRALNFDYSYKIEESWFPSIQKDGKDREQLIQVLRELSSKLQDKITDQLDRLKKEMLSEPSYIEEDRLYF